MRKEKNEKREALEVDKTNVLILHYKLLVLNYLMLEGESSTKVVSIDLKQIVPNFKHSLFYVTITMLKVDGYIAPFKIGNKTFYEITGKGKTYFQKLITFYSQAFEYFETAFNFLNFQE